MFGLVNFFGLLAVPLMIVLTSRFFFWSDSYILRGYQAKEREMLPLMF